MNVKPWNRRILLKIMEPEQEDSTLSGILVPDDYKPKTNDYVLASVVAVADDASAALAGRKVVVQPNGMEEFLDSNGDSHTVTLENYIVAVLED